MNLGDNYIQNFNLGRYFVEYTIGNLVLRQHASKAVKVISEHISDDIPPQIKIFNIVIPILMQFCIFISNWSVASCIKPHIIQLNVT